MKYNFKQIMETGCVQNDKWIAHNHFMIKKNILTKKQNTIADSVSRGTGYIEQLLNTANNLNETFQKSSKKVEFIPELITEYDGVKDGILYSESLELAINKNYYNMLKDRKCTLYKGEDSLKPLLIYKDEVFVGILLPINIKNTKSDNFRKYSDYLQEIEEEKKAKEELKKLNKKCLYINNNKAIIRSKPLKNIGKITGISKYDNLYVDAEPDKFGDVELFIDLGIVHMSLNRIIDIKSIEDKDDYVLGGYDGLTIEDYKTVIENRIKDNQWITVSEVKLMELAGEPEGYIKSLENHRVKVRELREQERIAKEEKQKKDDAKYVEEQNAIAEDIISKAEQSIVNGKEVKNQEIILYEDRYTYKETSLVLHLMKKYNVKVHLRTQGWINNALHSIYLKDSGLYTYKYYSSSSNSTVFEKYLDELIEKIKKEYSQTA